MAPFKMIPKIDAGDLPFEVEEELMSWNDELCFHGDGGCVFHLRADQIQTLPLFTAWMISIGAWTEQDACLPSYSQFAVECNVSETERDYAAYYKWLAGRCEYLTIAMTGT